MLCHRYATAQICLIPLVCVGLVPHHGCYCWWAAQYNTRLLIELTLKGVAFSVSPLLGIVVHISALHVCSNV